MIVNKWSNKKNVLGITKLNNNSWDVCKDRSKYESK